MFQFAGHGTTVPDRDFDELGGDSPSNDEALCPIDFTEGRLIVDDDLAAVFRGIPDGVRVTSFIDACHSGSVTRFGVGPQRASTGRALDERPRFIEADDQLIEAHLAFRAAHGGSRGMDAGTRSASRDTLFSACQSIELAWESNGQGDFTRHATRLLTQGVTGVSHAAFLARIQSAFGASPRQHPELHPPNAGTLGLLLPETRGSFDMPPQGTWPQGTGAQDGAPQPLTDAAAGLGSSSPYAGDVATMLRAIADLLAAR